MARVAHQRDVTLDDRERLLAMHTDTRDGIALATCQRVEVYEVADQPSITIGMRTLVDEDAAAHLFRVATGLDSTVAGEPQILRQVRAARESSREDVHPLVHRLFERALHVGRSIRQATRLGEVRRSVGSLAVDEVVAALEDPKTATVIVIGAGEMGKLAVRALSLRVAHVLVANRDRARAEAVAAESHAEAIPLEELRGAIARADALISAADTRGALLTRELLAQRTGRRALVLVDIAVPRSVAADARDLESLVYRSVDDLADGSTAIPDTEIAWATEQCATAAADFLLEWRQRAAVEAIREVRASAEALRRVQLDRTLRKLGHLGARDRRVVEAMSVSLTNALLHAPTVALREEPSRVGAARELFRSRRPAP